MSEEKRINAGFEIVAQCDLPDKDGLTNIQIVVGKRLNMDNPDYCTWHYSKQGQYNFGNYNLDEKSAYENMVKRAAHELSLSVIKSSTVKTFMLHGSTSVK